MHLRIKEENIRIYRRYIVYRRRWIRYIDKIYRLTKILVNIGDNIGNHGYIGEINKISVLNEKKIIEISGIYWLYWRYICEKSVKN